MERQGIATASEVEIETVAKRISDEVVAMNATVTWFSLVGATSRKPTE